LIDPLWTEGIEPELAALGTVVAIIMTLRWHERDVNRFARRFDVPVYLSRQLLLQAERNRRRRPILVDLDVPIQYVDTQVPDSPLRLLAIHGRGALAWWKETAVWWPERRILAVGDAVGTARYFLRRGEELAVHPARRLSPPNELAGLQPRHVLCGHGVAGAQPIRDPGRALDQALRTARVGKATSLYHWLRSAVSYAQASRRRRRRAG